MKVRIAQCLCKERHAILAFMIDDDAIPDTEVEQMLRAAIELTINGAGLDVGLPIPKINPWCGLCGAKAGTWSYEVRRSKEFTSWDGALEFLKTLEARNMITRALAEMMGVSYDVQRKAIEN